MLDPFLLKRLITTYISNTFLNSKSDWRNHIDMLFWRFIESFFHPDNLKQNYVAVFLIASLKLDLGNEAWSLAIGVYGLCPHYSELSLSWLTRSFLPSGWGKPCCNIYFIAFQNYLNTNLFATQYSLHSSLLRPSLLYDEQSQLSHSLPIGEVLQSLNHLIGP